MLERFTVLAVSGCSICYSSNPGVIAVSIDIQQLRDLSVVEKLQIVTALWDDIAASPEPLVIPQEVIREASRRSDELKDDPALPITDAELWRRVDG